MSPKVVPAELQVDQIKAEQANFITRVYGWMCFALIITGSIAWLVASSPEWTALIFSSKLSFYGLLIARFLCVAYLVGLIEKITSQTAVFVFLFYAALNGFTLAVIFLVFTTASVATTFFITAGTFGVMSIYGYYTKTDLTSLGNLAIMSLFGLIIASVVNLFFFNEMVYWITTYAGILIFVGLTAYDTQKIKQLNIIGNDGTDEDKKEAIMGALTLYLDFINLFLYLLRIFGRKK